MLSLLIAASLALVVGLLLTWTAINGSESSVLECGHVPVSDASNCAHITSDVGVICRGTSIHT